MIDYKSGYAGTFSCLEAKNYLKGINENFHESFGDYLPLILNAHSESLLMAASIIFLFFCK